VLVGMKRIAIVIAVIRVEQPVLEKVVRPRIHSLKPILGLEDGDTGQVFVTTMTKVRQEPTVFKQQTYDMESKISRTHTNHKSVNGVGSMSNNSLRSTNKSATAHRAWSGSGSRHTDKPILGMSIGRRRTLNYSKYRIYC